MSKTTIGVLLSIVAVVVIAAFLVGTVAFGYWDFTNQANRYENAIKAKYTDNQNVYDNGVKKVLETFKVADANKNAVKEVVIAAIQGRYGQNGAQAVFQTLQEDNAAANQMANGEMYKKVMQIIESFRDKFEQNQRELTSQWNSYNDMLTGTRNGTFYNAIAGMMGGKFPRINQSDYTIVTSERTDNAFKTKKDEAIDLQPSKPEAPAQVTPAPQPKPRKSGAQRLKESGIQPLVVPNGQLPVRAK